jgi:hypothetical protein
VKPIGVSKNYCLSNVPGSSQSRRDESHHTVETIVERAPHVITFDNLGDDLSPDIRETLPPKRVGDVPPSPPPFLPGELPSHAFTDLLKILMLVFCR